MGFCLTWRGSSGFGFRPVETEFADLAVEGRAADTELAGDL